MKLSADHEDGATDRILFVDDDETVRHLAETALAGQEVPFDILADGAAAWDCFERHRHAIVFTDLKLPGLSGEELLRRVKSRAVSTEVIVVTAYPSLKSAIATFKTGAYDYLLKPIQAGDLRRTVERCRQTQRLRRELMTERQMRRKFEELCDLKTHFLANVSHELRTPLQVILGYADLVGGTLRDDAARRDLDCLARSAQALSDIVDDLLMLTQIDAGSFRASARAVDVARTLEAAVRAIAPLANKAGLEVALEVDPLLGERVTDPDLLKRLLGILLVNALKFTSEGGLSVEARLSADESTLEITVADTGIGIPEELLETVFEDFRQADGSATRQVGGMGVGLALARRIVLLLGGAITASNRQTRGTEFRVFLPAKVSDADVQRSGIGSEQR